MSTLEPAQEKTETPSAPTSQENPPQDTAAPPPEAQSLEPVEKVRKIYVRDLQEKERIETVFRVTKKSRQVSRNGKVFLALVLSDKTGDIDARIFDHVEKVENKFAVGDFALISGEVIAFHGRPQILVQALDRLDPEPIDPAEFIAPKDEASRAVSQLREILERVHDPNVRSLLLAFLDEPNVAENLKHAPAGKAIHHAYKGGLAEHILSVTKLALRVADHYPMADRDLLVAGAFLHDIGKVSELSYDKSFEYTDEGRLVGHLVMTAQKIHEKALQIPNFPPLLQHHLTHLVIAHHGYLEHGSPKVPMTLEALMVHLIDLLDSRVSSWLEIMAKDSNEKWTEVSRLYDRQLWKGPVPTVRAKSPVEGKTKRREGERERRKPQRPQSPAVASPTPTVVFKPLSELTGPQPTSSDGDGATGEGSDGGGKA